MLLGIIVTSITLAWIKNPDKDYVESVGTRFIAHRGLSNEYYQNTEEAFRGAGESDFFYGIETDIFRTKDGYWVCCHDENPFSDESVKIGDITLEEAVTLPLSEKKAGDAAVTFPQYICTFDTYLQLAVFHQKVPIIELKSKISNDDAKNLLSLLDEKGIRYGCQIISFEYSNINMLRKMDGKLALQQLTRGKGTRMFFELAAGHNAGINYKNISKTLVSTAHRNGCTVNVWTVNEKAIAEKLVKMGVDYITTDCILF